MGTWTARVRENPGSVYQKAQGALTAKGLNLQRAEPGQLLVAVGHRAYRLVVLIILVLVCWPGALIYYFTRKKSSITVQIQPQGDGSYIQVETVGETADEALGMISSGLNPA